MQIIDLTHTIAPEMPVYPGTEQPKIITGCSIEKDGFLEKKVTMYSHTGTHIDAPAHLLSNAKTLDMLDVDHFYGAALVLNVESTTTKRIDVASLEPYKKQIEEVDFLLIRTGWSRYWGTDKYFSDFTVLSEEAAHWLAGFRLKGIGVDTISVDPSDTVDYPVHKILLDKEYIIIENLVNLALLPESVFHFSCFPLKLESADGSPVRAIAYI